ncbi:MAG: hypothetical protein WB493_14215 [Anaeromyxobacteraceae bacterium]
MKNSYRQPWLAPLAVIVAVVVSACGQVTTSDEATAQAEALRAAPRSASVATQAEFDACYDPTAVTCTPTGAHAKHTTDCTVCHVVAGRLAFRVGGPAYPSGWAAGQARPSFDALNKTCSNVSCHGVPSGTFSYTFPGGDGTPEPITVNVYGSASRTTPSWYATGGGCTACHDNPPRNGTDGSNAWHSGFHANQGPAGAANQCQFCHPDATGSNGLGTTITNPNLHGNGIYNVQARFTSACFGCH